MKEQIEIIQKGRSSFIELMHPLSIEQLNHIPEGFSNNIVWNFGHIIAVQQGLCYGLGGIPAHMDVELIKKYRKGSKPGTVVELVELIQLSNLSVSLIDTFVAEMEHNKNVYAVQTPLLTALGYSIDTFEKAVQFNTFHEGLHYGYAMALKRAVLKDLPILK